MKANAPLEVQMARPLSSPLDRAITEFLDAQHGLRPKTKHEYERSLRRFDTWLGGGTLRDLDPKNVNAYVQMKVKAGSKYMARNEMATLKVFAKWLEKAKIVRSNPLLSVEVPKVSQKGRAPFSDREVSKIVEAAGESRITSCRQRDRVIVMLALYTGLRLNELRSLRWPEDIDLREMSLHVRASKTDAGIRAIPLDEKITSEIIAYVRNWRPIGEQAGPLFINQHGQPFTYNGFARIQSRLHDRMKEQGIDYKIHRMRNTWAAKCRTLNWDVLDIQQVGGWTDLAMVRRYAGAKPASELRKLPTMSQAFGRL